MLRPPAEWGGFYLGYALSLRTGRLLGRINLKREISGNGIDIDIEQR